MGRTRGRQGPRRSADTDSFDEYLDASRRVWRAKSKAEESDDSRSTRAFGNLQTSYGDPHYKADMGMADALGCNSHEVHDGVIAGQALLSLIKTVSECRADMRGLLEQVGEIAEETKKEVADNSDHASVSTDAVDVCSWWGDSTVYNTDVEQHSLQGEETVQGPDGELYAVFYPSDCVPEDSQQADSGSVDCASSEDCYHQTTQYCCPTRQACAEDGLANIVNFMSWSATKTYPARVKLFEMVQDAAMRALGENFQRFVLVGSTALRIDTPDSDLDAVVFTQKGTDEVVGHLLPARVLGLVADTLRAQHQDIEVQLVDCTRVPVLTVRMEGSSLSLDLTVDEAIGEFHVLWFQSLQAELPLQSPTSMYQVPYPSQCGWAQGLQAVTLRCVKWWLRRRKIPLPREGGFPSIAWTLMVLHALRCSVLVDDLEERGDRYRILLCALAAFFDRFSGGGLAGSLLFTVWAGAGFIPHTEAVDNMDMAGGMPLANLSVLDPTTTDGTSSVAGTLPTELAPQSSIATQLLYTYELRRAQALSAAALIKVSSEDESTTSACALQEVFADVDDRINILPASMPADITGVIALRANSLHIGILQCIHPKKGWRADFLHRRDTHSSFALHPCTIELDSGVLTPIDYGGLEWFRPCDFVCMALLHVHAGELKIDSETLYRWREMNSFVQVESVDEESVIQLDAEVPSRKKKQARGRRHRNGQHYNNQYPKVTERI